MRLLRRRANVRNGAVAANRGCDQLVRRLPSTANYGRAVPACVERGQDCRRQATAEAEANLGGSLLPGSRGPRS